MLKNVTGNYFAINNTLTCTTICLHYKINEQIHQTKMVYAACQIFPSIPALTRCHFAHRQGYIGKTIE